MKLDFREQSDKASGNYQVFKISVNSNGGQVRKGKEHKNYTTFYVLLSFLVCINTDNKVQALF